ncbi:uncharacterized protein LOC111355668 [Spodoptera litura]|uniref:Uncharacterized protein LOC111355668 n=1 Tax=Spodoptera litura TaxID=69820 RepID=A0A9J7ISB4_SPOLT|nr:uncharacterized protein LOC111355668 [Spodoptera litura]
MFGVVVVLSCAFALAATSSVNYCGAKMCGGKNTHTFCQYPEGPSPNCLGYIEAKLNIQEKARLLDRLNNRRNVVAMGGMRGFPSAGNMLKLRWVEELAREAQRWADQCRPPRIVEEHDACRDLYSLTVGQCVASVVGESPGLRVESMVDIWYIQSMLYKGNSTFYVPPGNDTRYYGDFAQIIWAKSYMVGCGRSRFMTSWQGRLRSVERLVCNIAPFGPHPTRSLWIPAAPTAACPYRAVRSSVWGGLCDYQRKQDEIVSLDPSTTLEEHILLNTILEIEENETLNYLGSIDEIYLTKLAIAKLANSLTTKSRFNSKQRREVVDFVEVIEFYFNDSTIAFIPQVLITHDFIFMQDAQTRKTTIPLQTEMTLKLTTETEEKMSLIGRTSTNNKENLSNFDGKTENIKTIKEMPQKEKNNIAEYIGTITSSTTSENLLQTTEVPKFTSVDEVSNLTSISKDSSTTDDYEYHTYTAVPPKILDDVTKLEVVLPVTLKNPEDNEQDDYDDSDEPSGSESDDDEDSDDGEQSGDGKGSSDGDGSGDGDSDGSGDHKGSSYDKSSSYDDGNGHGRGGSDSDGEGGGDSNGDDVRKNNRFGAMYLPNKTADFFNYGSDPETVLQLQEALHRIEEDLAPKKENQKRQKVRRELHHKSMEKGRPRKHRKKSREEEEIPQKVANGISPLLHFMELMPKEGRNVASPVTPSLVIVLVMCLNNCIV